MNRGIKAVVCLIGGVVTTTGVGFTARGAVENNPYNAIVERNVFDLKPPPPPPAPVTVTNTPPPNVKLTGITSILGAKRALFMVGAASQPGKPPGKEESYILEEGQRQGVIEVLEINQKAATVKIKNDGTESVIALDTSPKLPSGPGGGAAPGGGPGGYPGAAPRPTFAPPAPGMPGAAGARSPGTGLKPYAFNNNAQSGASPLGNGSLYGSADNGMTTLPTRTLRTGSGVDPMQLLGQQPQQPQPEPQPPEMPLEQKIIMTEIERQRTQPLVDQGLMPPIPDEFGFGKQGAQGQNGTAGSGTGGPNVPMSPTGGR